MNQWEEIKEYLLKHDDCKYVHKLVWDGFAMITERNGSRHKITSDWSLEEVKSFIRETFLNKYHGREK